MQVICSEEEKEALESVQEYGICLFGHCYCKDITDENEADCDLCTKQNLIIEVKEDITNE